MLITVFSRAGCRSCDRAKELLAHQRVVFADLDAERHQEQLKRLVGGNATLPQIFIHNTHIGGVNELHALIQSGRFLLALQDAYDFSPVNPDLMNKADRPRSRSAATPGLKPSQDPSARRHQRDVPSVAKERGERVSPDQYRQHAEEQYRRQQAFEPVADVRKEVQRNDTRPQNVRANTVSGTPPTRHVPRHFVDFESPEGSYNFDLFIIGGGSGGLACAKAARGHGLRVGVADYVKPSPQGSTWGLGGTCVNVGCIPKKLMHAAGLYGRALKEMPYFGWCGNAQTQPDPFFFRKNTYCNWEILTHNVNAHIRRLNTNYVKSMDTCGAQYFNAFARLGRDHTVHLQYENGQKQQVTARRIVIAVGGRPVYPDVVGKEYGITSDDLFYLKRDPGKTLIVGASYVALECAGFLTEIGREVTVAIRSAPLRGFDQQMAELIVAHMKKHGTKFLRPFAPERVERSVDAHGKQVFTVTLTNTNGQKVTDTFDTVMWATGRKPCTQELGLEVAGVKVDKDARIVTDAVDRTSVPYVYAIGDVAKECLELTPVAVMAAKLLVDRLYNNGITLMDYFNIATTVFTPLEYGCCGLSEETAIERYGQAGIEVYQSFLKPLEWELPCSKDTTELCYMKVICDIATLKVLGFHILSPHAGEITQAMAVAIRMGATKHDLDNTIGIHPTIAEELTILTATKRSGAAALKQGC